MPQITHSSFAHMSNKEAAPAAPALPVYSVMPPEVEQQMFAAQMAAQDAAMLQQAQTAPTAVQNGIPGIMDDKAVQANLDRKKVFEKLVLFREDHTVEIELAGLKFLLKLLNANDNSYVLKYIKTVPPDEQVSKLSIMVLSAAMVSVNGIKLEEVYSGPPEITEPVLMRYYELNQWHSPVITALSNEYYKFQSSVEKEYTKDFLAK